MAAPKRNRGLGKGLDALFGDVEVTLQNKSENEEKKEEAKQQQVKFDTDNNSKKNENSGILYIDINDIKPNSNQPRKIFDEEKLDELGASIQAHGLIQPIVLRSVGKGFEIVAGERRWRAARKIGIKEVPCIVKELSDEENMLLAIIENMQREDLNPIEEAEGLNQMIETYGLTQEQVSKSVGKSRPYITNCLRLLRLAEAVKNYISDGSLSMGHAKAIAAVTDEKKQIMLAENAVKNGLSVRQTEKLVKENKSKQTRSVKKKKDADVKKVEEDLKDALGTKVVLNQKGKKGKIEIEYYSKEELERLIELLRNLKN